MAEEVPIFIDGSQGVGGGQLLRTALALSCVTGRPFGLTRFRAGRPAPGMRPHHLGVARAAARLCGAELTGDAEGSERVAFAPRRLATPGEHRFDAGPGGSATLLLQTLCWPLWLAGGPSSITITGATHQAGAPSFHAAALVWGPAVARLGFAAELGLQAAGFEPEGDGSLTARLEPARPMPPLDLRHRGLLRDVEVLAMVGGLPWADAEAEAGHASRALTRLGVTAESERLALPVRSSRGRHTLVVASFERVRSGHEASRAGARAGEGAAAEAVEALAVHLDRGGAVEPVLAEQLLLPAALLAARRVVPPPGVEPVTRYTTGPRTAQLGSTVAVIRRFLDIEVSVVGPPGGEAELRVQPPGGGAEVLPLQGR